MGILSKDYPDKEVKMISLFGIVYYFSVDCKAQEVKEIKNIYTYLMKRHNVKQIVYIFNI